MTRFAVVSATVIGTTYLLLRWSATLTHPEREFLLDTLRQGCLVAPVLLLFLMRPVGAVLLAIWGTASLVLGCRYAGDMGEYGHMVTGVLTFVASIWALGLGIAAIGIGPAFRRSIRLERQLPANNSEAPRRPVFSLPSLIVTVATLAVVFGYVGAVLDRSVDRRRVVDLVERLGGSATIPFTGSGEVSIGLGHCEVTDRDVAELTPLLLQLHSVDRICLNHTSITDRSLPYVANVGSVEVLLLRGTSVSDDGLLALSSLDQLGHLDVSGTRATQQGVDRLRAALPHCRISGP